MEHVDGRNYIPGDAMNFKPVNDGKLTPISLKEWDESVEGYLRPLGGFEQLVFNDYFLEFYDETRQPEERFNAGFNAALMVIVDKDGAPLIADSDRDAVRNASFAPIIRVFTQTLTGEIETAKKN